MAIATVNPTTGVTECSFEPLTSEELETRLARASTGLTKLRNTSLEERTVLLDRLADILDDEVDRMAAIMTTEMGKTLASAKAEVRKCALGCRYYAKNAAAMLAAEPADATAVGAARAEVRYQPLGVVLAVMPWNFPAWQAIRFIAPALAAGNAVLLKHASNVPQSALLIEELVARAGFPEGAMQTLLITSDQVASVLRDERVAAATLTGSENAGRAVASLAGEQLKKMVLELGGSDPFIVLPSADVERAAEVAVTARTQNNGQSCIAAKRFIVHQDVYEAFTDAFVSRMAALRVGDPTDPETEVGPLASRSGVTEMTELVEDARSKGARVLCGGAALEGDGWFYPPTVVADISAEMRLFHEEAFGPLASLYRVASLDEAICLANATRFGLGSSVWTDDDDEVAHCVESIESGAVFVNGMTASFPELPFGGVKLSGYGRELSLYGLREFCNAKTVWVR
ncbi:NADP-dependent succinic semialdehyde dehydrogenase [Mycolicibacterium confluentis]|uniref:Succinate-semialdehyde dehydrogenase [NADP(+)] 1 n=1 Tax=Mycolicibacterium confluentis TaxID=28047 RepID=A0A7I7Y5P1_9MYCO|nr:NADP-dependent succinic semialdehyde dehydrogenase [Mycolicibacterium confluentis]MCV7322676.1 NADP-dependent succinic semialdehyde dehydrogenase [Mycolicibacterium confluentis]ORV29791.1 succinate-semialdehyde dehydrogenase [Mycolicibacterium confluentis]BBZ36423.1 succinate-semialdehyde dehydrogenase [NADP(+)] 1 [Mycolicibacterium confluentis]